MRLTERGHDPPFLFTHVTPIDLPDRIRFGPTRNPIARRRVERSRVWLADAAFRKHQSIEDLFDCLSASGRGARPNQCAAPVIFDRWGDADLLASFFCARADCRLQPVISDRRNHVGCDRADRHRDDRRRQRHRHRQHQGRRAGRDGHAFGAVVDDAQIAVTDEHGGYRFSAVPTGDHTLTFELAGFATIVREGIHVGLGFTATVNVEISPGSVSDASSSAALAGRRPRRRPTSRRISTARSSPACRARATSSRSWRTRRAWRCRRWTSAETARSSLQEYTAYGLRATTGVNRNEVEGIRVGGANGAQRQLLFRLRVLCRDCHQGRRTLRRRCRCRARWASTSASPAATPITAASTRISRTTRWKRPTSTTTRSRAACPAGPASTRGT